MTTDKQRCITHKPRPRFWDNSTERAEQWNTVEANSIPNAGTRARHNYYHTPSTHTTRNCTTRFM